jgi:hypothetical protein
MIYTSVKKGSAILQYFIDAPNLGEAKRAANLLWGDRVQSHIHQTEDIVLSGLTYNYIVTIDPKTGRLNIPSGYEPYSDRELKIINGEL